MSTNRRRFLQDAGLGIAGTAAVSLASSAAQGANERLGIGLIGCGGRGRHVASTFAARDDVEIIHLADPHQQRLGAAAELFPAARQTSDLRHVLDNNKVDAVINATPAHWHTPATLLACRAGKHVYVEKPCSHNLREGRLLVDVARQTGSVVQHGTQVRSTSTIREGIQLLQEGVIGEVLVARAWNIQRRSGRGAGQIQAPPSELDYDLWLGPVPEVPYRDTLMDGWNWSRHFGTGEIGNDGIHDLDYARWGLGVETHPTLISGAGGRFLYDNGAEFPDTQQVTFEYPASNGVRQRLLIYEERLWSTNYPHNCDSGVEYYGTKGQMFLSRRGKIQVLLDRNRPHSVDVPLQKQDTSAHVANFVTAVRGLSPPHAGAEVAHLTTSLCHLGNLAIPPAADAGV